MGTTFISRLLRIATNLSGRVGERAVTRATSPHYPVDVWASSERLDQMIEWCHRNVKDEDWDYQTHPDPMLGDATAVRFYFANTAEAAAFGKEWSSKPL
jgi:hypothetical protein